MSTVPTHPRLAHLLLAAADHGLGATGADVAAVLGESGLRSRQTDLASRVLLLTSGRDAVSSRAKADARRFRRLVGVDDGDRGDHDALGFVAALGFPDRIGRRRGDKRGEFLLANGTGAFCSPNDPVADAEYVCAIETDGDRRRARIRVAVPLSDEDVAALTSGATTERTVVDWDQRSGDVRAQRTVVFGALALATAPVRDDEISPDLFTRALIAGIEMEGLRLLPWTAECRSLQQRLEFLHRTDGIDFDAPAVDDDALLADSTARIAPHLVGMRRRSDLRHVDVREILLHGLDWKQRSALDRLAPDRLVVPSGNAHRVDYSSDPPALAVKLQEMFGAADTPTVADGRVSVVVQLLSPAGRPLQVTQDLAGFWNGAYAEVRAEMRGRYPKHPWPEDPTTAEPTARTKRS